MAASFMFAWYRRRSSTGKYTVFGEVIEGIEVLDYISGRPANSNDFPLEKIVITSIKIEPRVTASPL